MLKHSSRRAAVLAIALGFVAIATAATAQDLAPQAIQGGRTVTAEQIVNLLGEKPNLVVIDNRRAEDFRAGHFEGAVRLLDTDLNEASLTRLAAKNVPVVFYCNGPRCGRAAKAAEQALSMGWAEVYYYYAGMEDWRAKGMPITR